MIYSIPDAATIGGGYIYQSRAVAITSNVLPVVQALQTSGFTNPGDGGGALYKRGAGPFSDGSSFQSADGAWWELTDTVVNFYQFGALADGSDDSVAIQNCFDFAVSNPLAIKQVSGGSGEFYCNNIYLPVGVMFKGHGSMLDANKAGTRFYQFDAGDILAFKSIQSGELYYWHGNISCFSLQGNSALIGNGINAIDEDGHSVNFQDQSIIENITIREMKGSGFNSPSGAFPLTLKNLEVIWCQDYGVKLTRVTQYQSVTFDECSFDGNGLGAIYLDGLSSNDNIVFVNPKFERRVNPTYVTGNQQNPIICNNCSDAFIISLGGSSISSVPDGLNFVKPGNYIQIQGGGTNPKILPFGVSIRVRAGDTGADPLLIGGVTGSVYEPPYTEFFALYKSSLQLFHSRLIFHRDSVGTTGVGIIPDVQKLNSILFTSASATTVDNFLNGVEGQQLQIFFSNSNVTINNNANIVLKTGTALIGANNGSVLLQYNGGKWKELARSLNANTGLYTISNVVTDRTYDASATTVAELANVLGTLVADLKTTGALPS